MSAAGGHETGLQGRREEGTYGEAGSCSSVRGCGRLRRGRCVRVLRGVAASMLPARARTRLEVAEAGRGSATDENWEPKGSLWLLEREAWGQEGWDWEPCCGSNRR